MIRLIPLDRRSLDSLLANPTPFLAAICINGAQVQEMVEEVAARSRALMCAAGTDAPWCGYLAVTVENDSLVGSCAFKSAPTTDGEVEIAYFTFPGFEGKGYATAMAGRLIQLALGHAEVRRVVAHTLPMAGGSPRVLAKAGLRCLGVVVDHTETCVWRWQVERSDWQTHTAAETHQLSSPADPSSTPPGSAAEPPP